MIEIQSFDNDKLWRKYENEAWSVEKFEPQSTAPISEFEQLKVEQQVLSDTVAEILMGV